MSILDSASKGITEFPMPAGQDWPAKEVVGEKFRVTQTADFELLGIRYNDGIGDYNKTVINIAARGISEGDLKNRAGEVAIWLSPDRVAMMFENGDPYPERRKLANVCDLLVSILGVAEANEFDGLAPGADEIARVTQIIDRLQPTELSGKTFRAQLYWEQKPTAGKGDNADKVYSNRDSGMRYFSESVTVKSAAQAGGATPAGEDLPF